MTTRIAASVFVSILSIAVPLGAVAQVTDGASATANAASGYALVIFSQPPLAEWPNAARLKNGKLDFTSGANGQYQASLAQARNAFRQWLSSTGSPAQIVRQYDTVLNGVAVQLNGANIDSLKAGPGVSVVEQSLLYHPNMNRSVNIIGAPALWTAVGGTASAGAGIKVGVIDTGIDQAHPFICKPTGNAAKPCDNALAAPSGFPKGDHRFTNNKVIVAKVYYTGKPGIATPEALQEHGTHVSGTIAGANNTTAPADGPVPAVTGLSGVAPMAFLGNYNVFPCFTPTNCITDSASHDIAQAIEDAVKDGMDVINMSLGGGINGFKDQLTVASNRAAEAGVVVAIAAGNSGPGANTVESPGQAELAITAAAATNNHFFGVPVHVGAATFNGAAGDFNPFVPAAAGTLANWNNTAASAGSSAATQACSAIAAGTHSGQIVVIDRGACAFSVKIRNAQAAGAAGVLVVNNSAGDPVAMGQDGTPNQPTIGALMLGSTDRANIRTAAGTNASADGSHEVEVNTANENILASFSSRGPANLLDIKPDVSAPGVNVYSSIPGGKFAMFQGTSMATPHVAGSSALILQQHPSWTPAQVKSALVNSATRYLALGSSNPQNIGDGVLNLAAASAVSATLEPASLSFRKIEPTSGQSKTIDVTITNVTSVAHTYNASVAITVAPTGGSTNSSAAVSPSSVTLSAGQSATVSVTVNTTQAAPAGQYWGRLTVTPDAGTVLTAPLWFGVRTYVDAGPLL
jgi:minor extracellular serine protease Vpr